MEGASCTLLHRHGGILSRDYQRVCRDLRKPAAASCDGQEPIRSLHDGGDGPERGEDNAKEQGRGTCWACDVDSVVQGYYPGRQYSAILAWNERLVASRLAGFLDSHGLLESRGPVLID